MRISTKGRYALRMMVDLAEHVNCGYISLKDIAQRQGISKKYLEQIIPILNRSDILKTTRGAQGGYMLAKDPEKYTVGDILRLTEGSLAPVACLESGAEACPRRECCPTLPMWSKLNGMIQDFFDGITLADLIATGEEKEASKP